jgi:UPF0716 family protein affecting phage T7 exclusion
MERDPPNNPLKLPFFAMCSLIGVFVAAVGLMALANGKGVGWILLIAGVAETVGCSLPIIVIRRGGNPRWMRAPLDRRWGTSPRLRAASIALVIAAGVSVLLTVIATVRNLS